MLLGDDGVAFSSELRKDVWVTGDFFHPLGLEGILVCVLLGQLSGKELVECWVEGNKVESICF